MTQSKTNIRLTFPAPFQLRRSLKQNSWPLLALINFLRRGSDSNRAVLASFQSFPITRWKPCWGWGPLTSNPLSVTWDFTVDYSNPCYLQPSWRSILFSVICCSCLQQQQAISVSPLLLLELEYFPSPPVFCLHEAHFTVLCPETNTVPQSVRLVHLGPNPQVSLAPTRPPPPQRCSLQFPSIGMCTQMALRRSKGAVECLLVGPSFSL